MKMKRFKLEKLIRGHASAFLQSKQIVMHERVMEHEEFVQRLKEKLLEEADEVKQTQNAHELVEELADVLEVFQALSQASGITMEEIEKKRREKREIKGGFEKNSLATISILKKITQK